MHRVGHPKRGGEGGEHLQRDLHRVVVGWTGVTAVSPRKVASGRERRCLSALRPLQSPGLARRM